MESNWPAVPDPDESGNYPAVEYARVSLARKLVRMRTGAGLTREKLARLTGMRVSTIERAESGKVAPSVSTVEKIDKALSRPKAKRKASKRIKPAHGLKQIVRS